MRVIGIFILLNTAAAATYLLVATTTESKRILMLSAVGLAIGVAFFIADRVTGVKLGGVAEIQAATSRAISGAESVEAIKKEVESHRDSISLIARDANSAHEKLGEVNSALSNANKEIGGLKDLQKEAEKKLSQLSAYSEFYDLSLGVRSDNRQAFDRILQIATSKDDFRKTMAERTLSNLPKEVEHMNLLEYQIDWQSANIDPSKASLQEFIKLYNSHPPIFQTKIMDAVWGSSVIPKKDKIAFLIEIIQSTPSLRCLDFACRKLNEETKVGKNFVLWESYTEWWNRNKDSL